MTTNLTLADNTIERHRLQYDPCPEPWPCLAYRAAQALRAQEQRIERLTTGEHEHEWSVRVEWCNGDWDQVCTDPGDYLRASRGHIVGPVTCATCGATAAEPPASSESPHQAAG